MSRFLMSEPEELLINGGSAETPARLSARASIVETFSGCGLIVGLRVDKEDLRRRICIPRRLRAAMAEAMRRGGEPEAVGEASAGDSAKRGWEEVVPEAPIVVFVNSHSGGRLGPIVKGRLIELIGQEQVFDLAETKPCDFVQYGLACLENLADQGDYCARSTRENLRVMVAGGDGTVGWVLGSLEELHLQNRIPIPPVGIIPLGTGNDLSRSFGWDGDFEGECPDKITCFEGVFYNYFSIGMDAQVAHGFHHFREEKPEVAKGPIANKLIYTGYSCAQGWFFTPCMSDPSLRGLNNILRLSIKKINVSNWEHIRVPSSVRAIVALNLHSYGSGRNPWGSPKPEYLLKKGFVEAQSDDGLLEIFGLKQGWHASFVMVELISAKHIAQAAAIRLEIRGGQWSHAFMQMDGEPWKQRISSEYSSFVEIVRVPHQSLMIRGD
ncbi:hypothetical protein HPP92_021622 [Vanilla planifolia]|uniref:Diacylglycerol kinase n=1 Tax=Vanilla planifolia TaxID=51239 RepID=A0A835PZ22_VANPL|nr:hypothetical protein HPP92_021622 [Vanilla planifolia]